MPKQTCVTFGCGNRVQRRGARCTHCRRYLRSAAERARITGTADIRPLANTKVEDVLVEIEQAIDVLGSPGNEARVLALRHLHAALQQAEPWRTLRKEIHAHFTPPRTDA